MTAIGIDAFGAYTPAHRLAEGLAEALSTSVKLPVCPPDEDAVTLAWEAVRRVEPGDGPLVLRLPDGDLEPRAVVAHLSAAGPLGTSAAVLPVAARTGATAALVAGAGLGTGTVVVLGDHGRPADPVATPNADGAAALRIGGGRAATVLATASMPVLAFDRWRCTGETGPPDPRFVEETLLATDGSALLDRLLKEAGLSRGDLVGVVLTSCVPVRPTRWAARWQVPEVWSPGAEFVAGRLAAATLRTAFDRLAAAGPGAHVAVLELGWGGDGFLLRAGDDIADGVRIVDQEATGTYGYRLWTRTASMSDSAMWTSPAKLRREAPALVGLDGSSCAACDDVAFPPRAVCDLCGGTDQRPVRLARTGTVASHNLDRLFAAPDRDVQMVVVDLDGGGRFFGQLAAGAARFAEVGDRVELVLRRLHDGGDLPHYFWKADLA